MMRALGIRYKRMSFNQSFFDFGYVRVVTASALRLWTGHKVRVKLQ
jgi:hypothetical protein